ncbi:Eco57I restriction-modification methylase domain-containing protein [Halogeometricum sp. CBA1124]|uniref:Eco57I restriction-modification methylase domain-containing protein n=1 Tax=Halogeometricum sp. CBA1124 TaxID=2668071 RepID=UPI00142C1A86|nr:Eco57I restriction-modification methylase domain-containing protein [Halogeometricum sp. CBA1124]MUV56231.1 N-6 DNA methylase [Halogeometricum sp. CBA1124]
MQARLDDWFAGLPDVSVEDDISGPAELESIISSSHDNIKLKLKFAGPIDDDLDERLNNLGFRTWKKSANLEMGNNDVLARRHEQIFDVVPEQKLTRSFVERGLVKEDIEQLNPFHWVMEFPSAYVDVEDDGSITHRSDPGFDVVLENPPYVRVQTMGSLKKDIYKDRHETITGKCDLYIPFIERSFELLSERGRTGIITSNLFMKTEYGELLRQHLPENYGLEQIFDFTAYSVFDDVTIYSTILFGSRDVGIPIDCVSIRSEEAVQEVKSTAFDWDHSEDIIEFTLTADSLDSERWLLLSEEERTAWEKIQKQGDVTLGNENFFTVGTPLKNGSKSRYCKQIYWESQATDSR